MIGRAVNAVDEVNDQSVCVVVMKDSVLVKKVQKLQDPSKLVLISLNEFYPPFTIKVGDILELWQVNSKISFDIDTSPSQHLALNQLQQSVETLKKEIQRLKD